MAQNKSLLSRSSGGRDPKRIVYVSAEGQRTEPEYFGIINDMDNQEVWVEMIDHQGSAPKTVLKAMKEYLEEHELKEHDRAWLVVDEDERKEKILDPLCEWSNACPKHGLALSNPCFEYWILLHYREPLSFCNCDDYIEAVGKYIRSYNKKNKGMPRDAQERRKLYDGIPVAIKRAREQDPSASDSYPKTTGTTVYKLAELLLPSSAEKTK